MGGKRIPTRENSSPLHKVQEGGGGGFKKELLSGEALTKVEYTPRNKPRRWGRLGNANVPRGDLTWPEKSGLTVSRNRSLAEMSRRDKRFRSSSNMGACPSGILPEITEGRKKQCGTIFMGS